MLLAIDTSAGTSVAVVDGDRVLSEASDPGTRGHAEHIGTLIQTALAEAGATPADITGVVSGMGPGPFTGLRVGIAAARAFAAGRGIPVHPVASHDAVASGRNDPDPRRHRRPPPRGRLDHLRRRRARDSSGPHLAHPEDLETAVEGYAGSSASTPRRSAQHPSAWSPSACSPPDAPPAPSSRSTCAPPT